MAYSEKLLDHFKHPKNVGTLNKDKKNVGTGLVGAPECGDVMRLQIEVDEATDTIIDAKFKTFGCGSAIASSSLATEWLKGKSIDEALTIDNMAIVEELALPPVKIHCSVLAEDAIKSAIADYKRIEEIIKAKNLTEDFFLRVSVASGGCSGLSYQMDFDNESKPNDQVFDDNGVRLVTDLKSFLYLCNTTLEFSGGLNGKGFYFNNPNAARTCGCGESFAV